MSNTEHTLNTLTEEQMRRIYPLELTGEQRIKMQIAYYKWALVLTTDGESLLNNYAIDKGSYTHKDMQVLAQYCNTGALKAFNVTPTEAQLMLQLKDVPYELDWVRLANDFAKVLE